MYRVRARVRGFEVKPNAHEPCRICSALAIFILPRKDNNRTIFSEWQGKDMAERFEGPYKLREDSRDIPESFPVSFGISEAVIILRGQVHSSS